MTVAPQNCLSIASPSPGPTSATTDGHSTGTGRSPSSTSVLPTGVPPITASRAGGASAANVSAATPSGNVEATVSAIASTMPVAPARALSRSTRLSTHVVVRRLRIAARRPLASSPRGPRRDGIRQRRRVESGALPPPSRVAVRRSGRAGGVGHAAGRRRRAVRRRVRTALAAGAGGSLRPATSFGRVVALARLILGRDRTSAVRSSLSYRRRRTVTAVATRRSPPAVAAGCRHAAAHAGCSRAVAAPLCEIDGRRRVWRAGWNVTGHGGARPGPCSRSR